MDGETLLSSHEWSDVEIGQLKHLCGSGRRFDTSVQRYLRRAARFLHQGVGRPGGRNKRPAVFTDEGLPGLARLPKLSPPPLPEINEEATAHSNEVLQLSRERMHKIDLTQRLSDCVKIAAEVDAETANV
jgi:hypothetical protein